MLGEMTIFSVKIISQFRVCFSKNATECDNEFNLTSETDGNNDFRQLLGSMYLP
jgi:hypothetical protein